MTWFGRWAWGLGLAGLAALPASAGAELLTVDRTVELALRHNLDVINAQAGVLDGRAGLYSAYGNVLPNLGASYSRTDTRAENQTGQRVFGSFRLPSSFVEQTGKFTSTQLSANWNIVDLSAWSGLRSALAGSRGTRQRRDAARNDIALAAKRQFYEVVKTIRLADVADGTVRSARDNERRVRALFEVGSVSKSDLLKARVRTSQSELDSIVAHANVTIQRVNLADLIGVPEAQLGELDTVLAVGPREYTEAEVLAEAERNRPDLQAAQSELAAARANLTAAHLARLPAVVGQGSLDLKPRSDVTTKVRIDTAGNIVSEGGTIVSQVSESETRRDWSGSLSLTWRYGLGNEGRVSTARARVLRAQEALAAARRNLAGEVREALLLYTQAIEGEKVARRAVESAQEDLKLSQEKYNVGSATILDLIDSQVAHQRAQSDLVSALATIRQAEAQVERVRGIYPR